MGFESTTTWFVNEYSTIWPNEHSTIWPRLQNKWMWIQIPVQSLIIKNVRNFFRLEKLSKETTDTTIKDIRDIFRLEKENEEIKDLILRNNRNVFENEEEENHYKLLSVSNFWSSYYRTIIEL